MSQELRTVTVTVTVLDPEHLPYDITQDEVTEEVKDVIQEAIEGWYRHDGRGLVACEPDVT